MKKGNSQAKQAYIGIRSVYLYTFLIRWTTDSSAHITEQKLDFRLRIWACLNLRFRRMLLFFFSFFFSSYTSVNDGKWRNASCSIQTRNLILRINMNKLWALTLFKLQFPIVPLVCAIFQALIHGQFFRCFIKMGV